MDMSEKANVTFGGPVTVKMPRCQSIPAMLVMNMRQSEYI